MPIGEIVNGKSSISSIMQGLEGVNGLFDEASKRALQQAVESGIQNRMSDSFRQLSNMFSRFANNFTPVTATNTQAISNTIARTELGSRLGMINPDDTATAVSILHKNTKGSISDVLGAVSNLQEKYGKDAELMQQGIAQYSKSNILEIKDGNFVNSKSGEDVKKKIERAMNLYKRAKEELGESSSFAEYLERLEASKRDVSSVNDQISIADKVAAATGSSIQDIYTTMDEAIGQGNDPKAVNTAMELMGKARKAKVISQAEEKDFFAKNLAKAQELINMYPDMTEDELSEELINANTKQITEITEEDTQRNERAKNKVGALKDKYNLSDEDIENIRGMDTKEAQKYVSKNRRFVSLKDMELLQKGLKVQDEYATKVETNENAIGFSQEEADTLRNTKLKNFVDVYKEVDMNTKVHASENFKKFINEHQDLSAEEKEMFLHGNNTVSDALSGNENLSKEYAEFLDKQARESMKEQNKKPLLPENKGFADGGTPLQITITSTSDGKPIVIRGDMKAS